MIEYEDFSLKIEPKRGDVYPVIVLRSPAGEGRASFYLPSHLDDVGSVMFDLGKTVRRGSARLLREASPAATRTEPQQIGDQLFNALFSGPVRSLLDRSLGMTHVQERGLRIKLHIDPEDPSLASLASLPWELMYRKETREFLNLSRFTPVVRYLDVQRPYIPLPLRRPLRILVLISSPVDYERLDLGRERARIEESWARQEGVQVEYLEQATILALQERLASRPYHVLHYMGHGSFEKDTGRGVLIMEDEGKRGAAVDGSTLGILLQDVHTLRLVFLNACDTARVTKRAGLDPFAGVASAMVMAGIPAVVAMQFPISDVAAIRFSGRFYPLLARGHPVDLAVAEGRRAIRLAESRTMEWATPVLFMRAPQGVVFAVSDADDEAGVAPQPGEEPLPSPADTGEFLREVEQMRQRDEKVAALYEGALELAGARKWRQVLAAIDEIKARDPQFVDRYGLAAKARQAMAKEAGEVPRQEEPSAPPAGVDKALAQRLEDLYIAGQSAFLLEEWDDAVRSFQAIVDERPDYRDVAGKLAASRQWAGLQGLYDQALAARKAKDYPGAISALEQLVAEKPDFKDAAALLEWMRRQQKVGDLYAEAQHLYQAQRWQAVIKVFGQIHAIQPDYADPEGLLPAAEEAFTAEQRRQERADLYNRAFVAMNAGEWSTARQLLIQLQQREPGNEQVERLLARAEAEIAKRQAESRRQQRSARQPRRAPLPAWFWPAAGAAVVLFVVLVVMVAALGRAGDSRATPTEALQLTVLAAEEPSAVLPPATDTPPKLTVAATEEPAELLLPATDTPPGATYTSHPPTDTPLPPTATPTSTQTEVPAETTTLKAGATQVWEMDDSVMVYVPEGTFTMGSDESDPDAGGDEKPQHKVYLDAFWIDRTEVTNAMFARFVADAGYQTDAEKSGSSWTYDSSSKAWGRMAGADWQHPDGPSTSLDGLDKHPVVHVSWNDSAAYCEWAGKRLPTEAEWEKAARGTEKRIYPWGDAFDGSLANFCDVHCDHDSKDGDWDDGFAKPAPVGSYGGGASPYGVLDMAGNVWEWVNDWYDGAYYATSPEDNPQGPDSDEWRVLRGGSWITGRTGVRAADRRRLDPSGAGSRNGFRCARSGSEP